MTNHQWEHSSNPAFVAYRVVRKTRLPYRADMLQNRYAIGQDVPPWFTPTPVEKCPETVIQSVSEPVLETWVDYELGRLANNLKLFPEWRVWEYARALVKRDRTGGKIEHPRNLYIALRRAGVRVDRSGLNKLLRAGAGVFWNLSPDGAIFLTGYDDGKHVKGVCSTLAVKAIEAGKPEWIATNQPGVKQVCVDLSGTVNRAKAQVYAAWFVENTQISRKVLTTLWNASKPTLLAWEHKAGIETQRAYSQHTLEGGAIITLQRPNIYVAPVMKQRQHRMIPRRARHAVNRVCEACPEVEAIRQNIGQPSIDGNGLNPTKRIYFSDRETKTGRTSGFKSLAKHLDWHGDSAREHYALLGHRQTKNGTTWIYEHSPDGLQRTTMRHYHQHPCQSAYIKGLSA